MFILFQVLQHAHVWLHLKVCPLLPLKPKRKRKGGWCRRASCSLFWKEQGRPASLRFRPPFRHHGSGEPKEWQPTRGAIGPPTGLQKDTWFVRALDPPKRLLETGGVQHASLDGIGWGWCLAVENEHLESVAVESAAFGGNIHADERATSGVQLQ